MKSWGANAVDAKEVADLKKKLEEQSAKTADTKDSFNKMSDFSKDVSHFWEQTHNDLLIKIINFIFWCEAIKILRSDNFVISILEHQKNTIKS